MKKIAITAKAGGWEPNIVRFLQDHGAHTLDQLHEALVEFYPEKDRLLDAMKALRKQGRIRPTKSKNAYWRFDEDFTCCDCKRCWPEVRRAGSDSECTGCFLVRYSKANRRKRQPGELFADYCSTRFSIADVGPAWAGSLADQWARRRLG